MKKIKNNQFVRLYSKSGMILILPFIIILFFAIVFLITISNKNKTEIIVITSFCIFFFCLFSLFIFLFLYYIRIIKISNESIKISLFKKYFIKELKMIDIKDVFYIYNIPSVLIFSKISYYKVELEKARLNDIIRNQFSIRCSLKEIEQIQEIINKTIRVLGVPPYTIKKNIKKNYQIQIKNYQIKMPSLDLLENLDEHKIIPISLNYINEFEDNIFEFIKKNYGDVYKIIENEGIPKKSSDLYFEDSGCICIYTNSHANYLIYILSKELIYFAGKKLVKFIDELNID